MNKLERVGAGMSLLCAIHCAAMPVLVGALPLVGSRMGSSHWLEALMIGTAALIGYSTLGMSFRRHRRPAPLAIFTGGLLTVTLAHTLVSHEASTLPAVVGALGLAGAQFLNRRYPTGGCCSCGHEHEVTLPAAVRTGAADPTSLSLRDL